MQLSPLYPELAATREVLAEHLPWSPLDYIPGISRRGDRRLYAEQLTAKVEPRDDLRFQFEIDGQPWGLFCQRLAWDSEFFGYGVARLDGMFPLAEPYHIPDAELAPALESLLERARQCGIRYLFAQIEPRDVATLRALGQLGFSLIETKYYHHGPVDAPDLKERIPIRRAVAADVPSLASTASLMVNQFDRFHADPFIRAEDANRLMQRWVEQSVVGEFADVTLVPDVERPTAFATFRYHRSHWAHWGVNLVQGILSAVSPEFAGWMGRVGPEFNHHLRTIGAEYSFGSTQVTNRAIIWFAQEAGARFGKCEHVFRILL